MALRDPYESTASFYVEKAKEYANETLGVCVPELWDLASNFCKPGGRVLDLGCGAGRDLRWLSSHGFSVFGLDRSYPLLRIARDYSRCSVVQADFRQLPFGAEAFDGVWAVASLLHLDRDDVPEFLRDLASLMRPSAVLICSLKAGHGERTDADGRRFTNFMPDEWIDIAASASFKLEHLHEESETERSIRWFACVLRLL